MKFGLYIENHKYKKGIEDYIFVIKNIFSSKNNSLKLVNESKDNLDVLFIIENFTDNIQFLNNFLTRQKEKGTKICLIHTEFLDKNGFFNIFTAKDLLFRKLILDRILYYLYKRKNYLITKIFLYSFYFFYIILGIIIGFKFKEIKKRIYFALRDHSFNKNNRIFDCHLAISDNLYQNLKENFYSKEIFYLQPFIREEFIKKLKKKNSTYNILYFTGNKTPFRDLYIKDIDKNLFSNYFYKIYKKNFKNHKIHVNKVNFDFIYSDDNTVKRLFKFYLNNHKIRPLGFELYIPQRKGWQFISPLRTIRSINNFSVPVNVGNFKDSSYCDLSINICSIDYLINNFDSLFYKYKKSISSKYSLFNKNSHKKLDFFLKRIKN